MKTFPYKDGAYITFEAFSGNCGYISDAAGEPILSKDGMVMYVGDWQVLGSAYQQNTSR